MKKKQQILCKEKSLNSLIIITLELKASEDCIHNTDIKLNHWDMISILKTLEAVLHVFYNYAVKKLIFQLYNSQKWILTLALGQATSCCKAVS